MFSDKGLSISANVEFVLNDKDSNYGKKVAIDVNKQDDISIHQGYSFPFDSEYVLVLKSPINLPHLDNLIEHNEVVIDKQNLGQTINTYWDKNASNENVLVLTDVKLMSKAHLNLEIGELKETQIDEHIKEDNWKAFSLLSFSLASRLMRKRMNAKDKEKKNNNLKV